MLHAYIIGSEDVRRLPTILKVSRIAVIAIKDAEPKVANSESLATEDSESDRVYIFQ